MTAGGYSGGRFRAAVLHYALGRGVNALASVALFVLLARALPVRDYAAYVTLWALLELLLAVGNLGTEWVTATEVPRLRQAQAWALLRRLVASALGVQALAFGSLGLLLALAGPQLAQLAGWSLPVEVWPWLGLHLLAEGLGRSLRDQMLSSLLLQWLAQAVQLLRNLVVLGGVAWWSHGGTVAVLDVVRLETLASAASMGLALLNLLWQLRHRPAVQGADVAPPDLPQLRRMALHAWLASLGSLWVSPQVLLLLASRALGADGAALLGFARNLAEQVRRFMPIEFGFSLLRTYLVAQQRGPGGAEQLLARTQVAWKLNALVLVPLLLVAGLWGEALAAWVGGERYRAAGALLLVWLLWVLIWSHHRLSDSLAHLLGHSNLVGQASLLLLPVPLLWWVALAQGPAGLSIGLLALAELLYSSWVLRRTLAAQGLPYPWRSLRIAAWALATGLALAGGLALRALALPWWLGAGATALLLWAGVALSGAVGREDWQRWRSAPAA